MFDVLIQKFEFMNFDHLKDKDPLEPGGAFVLFQTTTRLLNGSSKLTRCNYLVNLIYCIFIYVVIKRRLDEWLVRTSANKNADG